MVNATAVITGFIVAEDAVGDGYKTRLDVNCRPVINGFIAVEGAIGDLQRTLFEVNATPISRRTIAYGGIGESKGAPGDEDGATLATRRAAIGQGYILDAQVAGVDLKDSPAATVNRITVAIDAQP